MAQFPPTFDDRYRLQASMLRPRVNEPVRCFSLMFCVAYNWRRADAAATSRYIAARPLLDLYISQFEGNQPASTTNLLVLPVNVNLYASTALGAAPRKIKAFKQRLPHRAEQKAGEAKSSGHMAAHTHR